MALVRVPAYLPGHRDNGYTTPMIRLDRILLKTTPSTFIALLNKTELIADRRGTPFHWFDITVLSRRKHGIRI